MADAEEVVESMQTDAAAEVAGAAVEASIAGDAAIAGEVAAVADDLADHAELSEERHGEILEAESWVGRKVESVHQTLSELTGTLTASLATLQANQTQMLATLEALRTLLTPSPVSTQLTPVASETVVAVVEPESESTPAGPPETVRENRRRKRII